MNTIPINSNKSKKRIALTLLVVVLLIINVIASALIFIDIRLIEMPETTIKVDLIEIDSVQSLNIYSSVFVTIILKNGAN